MAGLLTKLMRMQRSECAGSTKSRQPAEEPMQHGGLPLGAPTIDDVIVAACQGLLGRAPDQAELASHKTFLETQGSLEALFRLLSANAHAVPPPAERDPFPLDSAPSNRLAAEWATADIQRLWDHVAATWVHLGKEDPFFSVSTSEDFHIDGFDQHADRFFQSSQYDIERMYRWFERHSRIVPTTGTIVEYGCGVGRSTPSLGRKFSRVKAFDISAPHIELARKIVERAGMSNVEFVHVSRIDDLNQLKEADLFYSCIVLQHNPPPVISEILTRALSGLNPGGFAFFQVPTYAKGYEFDLDTYLAQLPSGASSDTAMEMHLLPQESVFRIIEKQGCSLLEVQPDYCVGMFDSWISNTFFVEKHR